MSELVFAAFSVRRARCAVRGARCAVLRARCIVCHTCALRRAPCVSYIEGVAAAPRNAVINCLALGGRASPSVPAVHFQNFGPAIDVSQMPECLSGRIRDVGLKPVGVGSTLPDPMHAEGSRPQIDSLSSCLRWGCECCGGPPRYTTISNSSAFLPVMLLRGVSAVTRHLVARRCRRLLGFVALFLCHRFRGRASRKFQLSPKLVISGPQYVVVRPLDARRARRRGVKINTMRTKRQKFV